MARFDSSVWARWRSAGSMAVGTILTACSSQSGLPGAKTTPRLYARTTSAASDPSEHTTGTPSEMASTSTPESRRKVG